MLQNMLTTIILITAAAILSLMSIYFTNKLSKEDKPNKRSDRIRLFLLGFAWGVVVCRLIAGEQSVEVLWLEILGGIFAGSTLLIQPGRLRKIYSQSTKRSENESQ